MASFIIPLIDKRDDAIIEVESEKVQDPYRWLENIDNAKDFISKAKEIFKKDVIDSDENYLKKLKNELLKVYNCQLIGLGIRQVGKWIIFGINDGKMPERMLVKTRNLYGKKENDEQILNINYEKLLDVNDANDVPRKEKSASLTLVSYSFNSNGQFMAYAISENGSELLRIRIRSLKTGKDLKDEVIGCKTHVEWLKQCTGFFYAKYIDSKNFKQHSLFFHRLNSKPEEDVKIVTADEGKEILKFCVSHCGRYLIIGIASNREHGHNLHFIRLHRVGEIKQSSKFEIIHVVYKWDASYDYVTNYGYQVLFLTDKKAPYKHVIIMNFNNIRPKCHCDWRILIPERTFHYLETCMAMAYKTRLVLKYFYNMESDIEIYDMRIGALVAVIKPGIGYVSEINVGWRDFNIFYKFESPVDPGTIFRYQIRKTIHDKGGWWLPWFLIKKTPKKNGGGDQRETIDYTKSENLQCTHTYNYNEDGEGDEDDEEISVKSIEFLKQIDLEYNVNFEVDDLDVYVPLPLLRSRPNPSIVFASQCLQYPLKDITLKPIWNRFSGTIQAHEKDYQKLLIHKTSTFKSKIGFLRVKGILGEKCLPCFDSTIMLFILVHDSVCILQFIKGSGENGIEYHKNGILENRERIRMKSFIHQVEEMNNDYCEKVVVYGEGLLIAATIRENPNIIGAAILEDGPYDLLRHDEILSIMPHSWYADFGDPKNSDQIKLLYKFSVAHKVKNNNNDEFPPMLLTVKENDLRILPVHSFKYAAALQWNLKSIQNPNPVYLRIDPNVGHEIYHGHIMQKRMDLDNDIIMFVNKFVKTM